MPKSASAARSQARRCAAAIAAAFEGRDPAAADLDSVCYSLLDPNTALAIHGHFTLTEGTLRQSPHAPEAAPDPRYAAEAASWYADIRKDCFAA